MTGQLPLPRQRSVFRDDECIVQAASTPAGARQPRFGDTDWDMNPVLRRPANRRADEWRISFSHLTGPWELLARETSMIAFNPRHQALLTRGIHLAPSPAQVSSVRARVSIIRALHAFASSRGLPDELIHWSDDDFKIYVTDSLQSREPESVAPHVTFIKSLHQLAPVLADGGIAADPWPDKTASKVLDIESDAPLKTPAVKPEAWFPLVRAAWTYIDRFGPDILTARTRWQALQAAATTMSRSQARARCNAWLADPSNLVPIWHQDDRARKAQAATSINWSLLAHMIGATKDTGVFAVTEPNGRRQRAIVEQAVAEGRTQYGLLASPAEVKRGDGSHGPWTYSLHPHSLWIEYTALRNACYVFVAALSMMRDSEIREVLKDSVVEHYGSPAVKSKKLKLDPDLPVKHWWIIDPVARAIDTASQLSLHDELAFGSVQARSPDNHFDSGWAINSFIRHVNGHRHLTGLTEIPRLRAKPHMFRRTMAMLTRDFPGAEIAVGMQLKHAATRALANRTTQGYMDADPSWAKYLDEAIADRRFNRLKDLFTADSHGENIGFGPGADKIRDAFAAVRAKAAELQANGQARRGDLRVEYDLLRRTRISIRFGKLNHCTMDDSNPVGAKCIEDAVIPEGHHGPLIDRCQPSRCANSVLAPEHLPIWTAERASLDGLLCTKNLAPGRRALIKEQLREVNLTIQKMQP